MEKDRRRSREKQPDHGRRQVIRIDVLPDDVLLGIFDFYVVMSLWYYGKKGIEAWQSLVHVCRRWRNLVLGSPHGLNLRLCCTPETPTRGRLDVWPALPLIVMGNITLSGKDNIISALGQSNRVYQVDFWGITDWQLEVILAAMQVPFPELTDLRLLGPYPVMSDRHLLPHSETLPAIPIPDSFLDGSAPRLQHFELYGISFPGLPKLVLSAAQLVTLWLSNIPHSGYISPEAMVIPLSALSSLETLSLKFQSPQSRPDWESRRFPPLKRSILPALHQFHFKGAPDYLEDLVVRIDTPQLENMYMTFFNQIDFDCSRLGQFINRTPTLRAPDEAHVQFNGSTASVKLRYRTPNSSLRVDDLQIDIDISCRELDWQLSSIEQVCNSSLHPLSVVEDLYIEHRYPNLVLKNDSIENTLWLQLLLPFTAVKNLYLSKGFAPHIAAALQELVGGRITEVLPNLQNIFAEGLEPSGPFQENIGRFIAARELSDRPIVISVWDKAKDSGKGLM